MLESRGAKVPCCLRRPGVCTGGKIWGTAECSETFSEGGAGQWVEALRVGCSAETGTALVVFWLFLWCLSPATKMSLYPALFCLVWRPPGLSMTVTSKV